MAEAGKGSKPRPYSVSLEEFDNRWENIFGKKDKLADEQKSANEEITDHSEEDQ